LGALVAGTVGNFKVVIPTTGAAREADSKDHANQSRHKSQDRTHG
jgi:hypothetical protein